MPRHSASPIVTIDGPSGSGKGTISRAVARRTGWHLLDSGALYRLVALAGATAGLESVDERGHGEIAASMDARFGSTPDGSERVWLDGRDVTEAIRSEGAGQGPHGLQHGRRSARPSSGASGPLPDPRGWSRTGAIWAPWSSPGPT